MAAGDSRRLGLAAGTCARIMTGAPIPLGADTVVRAEWTDGGTTKVTIHQAVPSGSAIRRQGSEAAGAQVLLTAGTPLGPAQIGLVAAAGRSSVLVRPRPRLTVLSAGNELAPPGTVLGPGRIWESNSFMLVSAARRAGCLARRHQTAPDDRDRVLAAINEAADADLIITSGGISMGGERDSIKAALQGLGTASFCTVAIHPGKPQGFGVVGPSRTPVVMLPGNPVSAFVSFQLFVIPVVRALQGRAQEKPCVTGAQLTRPVRSPAGRRSFISGILDYQSGTVTPAPGPSAHQLTALAQANALIIVPEEITVLAEGATVELLELPS